jgi:transcriptional regulator GlxA family with amidase domain
VHTIAVLALPDTIAFDLSTPVETFGRVVLPSGEPGYRVLVCGTEPVVSAGPMRIATDHGIEAAAEADTIIVPGRNDVTVGTSQDVLHTLKSAYAAGTRIASICSGAFTLAEAGLLNGKRATTHWLAADLFRATFPAVDLDPDVLYVDEGQVLTSAGASAGLDLCLHMVARDYGAAVAAYAARLAVAPMHRSGGQAQFILRNTAPAKHIAQRTELDDVLSWIEKEAHRDLSLRDIAKRAAMSVRTLNRRFQAETGQTPMQWVTGVRIRHAQQLLESTAHGVEMIGRDVGFSSPANFREQFRRLTGVAPQSYRNSFRGRMAG